MEMIQVKYKEILGSQGVFYHKYIVYTDSDGAKWFARGGPSSGIMAPLPVIGFGYVHTITGAYLDGSIDWDRDNIDQTETIATGSDLSSSWQSILNTMATIDGARYEYTPFGQNSNTTVDLALSQAGLPAAQLDDYLESPGSPSFMNYYNPALPGSLSEWLSDVILPSMGLASIQASPLVLDLNGNGIELTALNGVGSVYWDIDSDGMAEAAGWVAPTDGLLALDWNGDGIITDHTELFGTEHLDGFIILSSLDSNGDNIINASDTEFS